MQYKFVMFSYKRNYTKISLIVSAPVDSQVTRVYVSYYAQPTQLYLGGVDKH